MNGGGGGVCVCLSVIHKDAVGSINHFVIECEIFGSGPKETKRDFLSQKISSYPNWPIGGERQPNWIPMDTVAGEKMK